MAAQGLCQFRSVVERQVPSPVGNHFTHRLGGHDTIGLSIKMRMNARPAPIVNCVTQAGADRIEFNISHGCKQVRFIHHKRMETFLPQVPSPAVSDVHSSCVAMMSNTQHSSKALFFLRHGN